MVSLIGEIAQIIGGLAQEDGGRLLRLSKKNVSTRAQHIYKLGNS